jgi:hypothetical protein
MSQAKIFHTTDGKVFVNETEAREHQLILDVQKCLRSEWMIQDDGEL